MFVSDTSPIIAFASIQRFDVLKAIAGKVAIPEAVYLEFVEGNLGSPSREEHQRAPWIKHYPVAQPDEAPGIHPGERDAITLALQIGRPLQIDEARGRSFALRQAVVVVSGLGILAIAKKRGIITKARPLLQPLDASGYRLGTDLVRKFLRMVGE